MKITSRLSWLQQINQWWLTFAYLGLNDDKGKVDGYFHESNLYKWKSSVQSKYQHVSTECRQRVFKKSMKSLKMFLKGYFSQ